MGWGAAQWARITKESSYGVYDAAAAAGDIAYMRLPNGNACTIRSVPQRMTIRSADGRNLRRQVVANRKVVSGNINTLFYPSQAALMFGAALTLTSNELASYTIDYFDSVQVHRFLGCKCASLTAAGTATGDYLPLSTSWVGQSKTTATFTEPAVTVFPTEIPYGHIESKGHLSIGGVVTKYSAAGISVKNTLDSTWDEDQYITSLLYCGRDVDLTARIQYLSSALRADLDAQTALTVSMGWARSAGLTTTVDMKTTNYVADCGDDIPLNAAAYQAITIQSFFSNASGADVALTVV